MKTRGPAVTRGGLHALALLDAAVTPTISWSGEDADQAWSHLAWWTSEDEARRQLEAAVHAGYIAEVEPGRYRRTKKRLPKPPDPPQRAVRQAQDWPACWGECGRWKDASKTARKRDGVYAVGPHVEVVDAEGRIYGARLELLDASRLVTSHDARTFQASPTYPPELQARQRAEAASRLQVEALARALEPLLLVAPSSSPADGPPVVWRGFVVSGNGRTMAFLRWHADHWRTMPTEYRAAVERRWRSKGLSRSLSSGHPEVPLLVVRVLDPATPFERVVQLAGASQTCPTAELSRLERALSRARSAGIVDPLSLGTFEWLKPLNVQTFRAFVAANPRWWKHARELAGPARQAVLDDPERGAQWATDLLVGGLPAEVLAGGLGEPRAAEALLGALPAVWTLEQWARPGGRGEPVIRPEWRLLPVLPAAKRWIALAGSKTLARLALDIDAADRTVGSTVADEAVDDHEQARLGVALAVALIRAGNRQDPEGAAAGYLETYSEAARADDPRQGALLGGLVSPPDPGATLATIVRFRWLRSNPCGCGGETVERGRLLEFGWRLGFDLEGLGRFELPDDWSLLAEVDSRGRLGGPALLGRGRGRAVPRGPAARAWRLWSGEPAAEARTFELYGPEDGGLAIGQIRRVFYRTVRERDVTDFVHAFHAPLPELVQLPAGDGWYIRPGRSRHRVTERGIVG